jgi:hypothetical protein
MRTDTVLRIAVWASVGALVALAWGYFFAAANKALPIEPNMRTLAELTQPVIAARHVFGLHSGISLHGCVLLNAATYGLLGLFVETIRRSYRPSLST